MPLAGVDFSTHPYTYDETPGDFNLTQFALSPEDLNWKIPFVKAAMRVSKKKLKLFASAWTAPPWSVYFIFYYSFKSHLNSIDCKKDENK